MSFSSSMMSQVSDDDDDDLPLPPINRNRKERFNKVCVTI